MQQLCQKPPDARLINASFAKDSRFNVGSSDLILQRINWIILLGFILMTSSVRSYEHEVALELERALSGLFLMRLPILQ